MNDERWVGHLKSPLKTVITLLVAALIFISFNRLFYTPSLPKWTAPWSSIPQNNTAVGTSQDSSSVDSSDMSSVRPLKAANETLLKIAPPYIQAIMNPADTRFPRLECPAPDWGRYQYLNVNTTDMLEPRLRPLYFFALDLHQSATVLPRLLGTIVESIRFLGSRNCALSIVEGRSDDGTFEILLSLRKDLELMGVTYYLNSSNIDPSVGDRIRGLAELRNQALQPVLSHPILNPDNTTVVFLNDVAICMEDVLELILQRHFQQADMVCPMDWTYLGPDPTFYDVWIARGMNGDTFFKIPEDGNWNSAWNIFWNNPVASQALRSGTPFQVFSCWNGAAVFTAKPYLESRIRFRSWYEDECPQGEPKTFCEEMWHLGYGKIAVVPSVNLEYSDEAAKKIKAAKGYVSSWVKDETDPFHIEWSADPPSTVKCMPSYESQTWLPWNETLADHEPVP